FRWHFVHEEDFTVYADIGIGILGATDNVPSNGTSFDFTPRAGVGFTYALNDAGDLRLVGGLRWAHVSNARIHGDDDNPGVDTIMMYSGVQFPF
ncbi:MAG: acyloxyacyl hydrolase, partial [Phycisphaerales bacterium]